MISLAITSSKPRVLLSLHEVGLLPAVTVLPRFVALSGPMTINSAVVAHAHQRGSVCVGLAVVSGGVREVHVIFMWRRRGAS